MTAIETAYVHIGLHKTGTTSIQQTFARYRTLLRDGFGLIYPSVANNHSVPLFSMFCDDPADYSWNKAAGATGMAAILERNEGFALSLAEDLAGNAHTLLLSGEDLGLLSPAGVRRFQQWLAPHTRQVKILAYVREPVAWATSQAQQQVRHGKTLEALSHVALVPRFRKRLLPWLATFGREAIAVHDFDIARHHPEGLVGHFAAQLGLPPAIHATIKPRTVNQSYSAEAIALLSALNAQHPRPNLEHDAASRTERIEAIFARIEGQRFTLSPEAIARTRAASAIETEWLAAQFALSFAQPPIAAERTPLFAAPATLNSLARLLWTAGGTITPPRTRPPPSD